jgi:hypothetical protein
VRCFPSLLRAAIAPQCRSVATTPVATVPQRRELQHRRNAPATHAVIVP